MDHFIYLLRWSLEVLTDPAGLRLIEETMPALKDLWQPIRPQSVSVITLPLHLNEEGRLFAKYVDNPLNMAVGQP